MSDIRDIMLYQICPTCKGTGNRTDSQGYVHDCCCKPLRVVAVGFAAGQLERMARREIIEAEQRAGYDRVTGSLTPAVKPNEAQP